MNKRTKVAAVVGGAVVIAGVAGGVAVATGDDGDVTVTGPEADRATQAALAATHGGTANSVERDSEDGATWEVEVTKEDGSTVDVRLDEQMQVVVIEGDHEDAGEGGSGGDD
ncbi:PepSY domain-containing protein [Nocardioides iriomotensis]|uniref:Uncharacterized protein n=1 Tax=Nocardioides iriomotensis TaxID=715784 RepID=A0A4Q5J2H3_9ACTN|nr:PepSY domain-containing protein [Nocardioides iriomotensis]RYU12732.1 hypothetical protein ETU37_07080 [Nocardioides iriomotensis]